MKGFLGVVVFVIVVLLLRSTALTALAARGIVIDVLAIAVAVWALRDGDAWGTTFGFALGIAADLDSAHWLGRHALILSLLGYVVGRLSRTLVRDSMRTHLVVFLIVTLVHQAWAGAFEFGFQALPHLALRAGLAALVTAPVGALFLVLARMASGHSIITHATQSSGSKS
jgi:rod shape-determining protein MreD